MKQPVNGTKKTAGRRSADAAAGSSTQKGRAGMKALAAASGAKARKQGFSPTSDGYANAKKKADYDLVAYAMKSAAAKKSNKKSGGGRSGKS